MPTSASVGKGTLSLGLCCIAGPVRTWPTTASPQLRAAGLIAYLIPPLPFIKVVGHFKLFPTVIPPASFPDALAHFWGGCCCVASFPLLDAVGFCCIAVPVRPPQYFVSSALQINKRNASFSNFGAAFPCRVTGPVRPPPGALRRHAQLRAAARLPLPALRRPGVAGAVTWAGVAGALVLCRVTARPSLCAALRTAGGRGWGCEGRGPGPDCGARLQ